ncbi:glutamate 5-kinase [Treponema saccharophilum]|uniref:glutamate 5-kinase n=1 Tax=Treponema saccharophilum TaxID=165 RepID=UPI00386BC71B
MSVNSTIQQTLADARKIVIKIGSNTLAKADGTQNTEFMQSFARQCRNLIDAGKSVVVVSSGAQVSGVSTLKEWARKKDVHFRQALAAIGQVELMAQWRKAFGEFDIHIGQLLFTKDDFEDNHRSLNIRNTIFTLVDEGAVPIINENDSVSTDEFAIGDNDNLSALTAILWSADLLILFSDIDGIYTDNPKTNPNAQLVETVADISELRKSIKIGGTNSFGTGGIETKIQAAEKTVVYGIPLLLANGGRENILDNLVNGTATGTLFLA